MPEGRGGSSRVAIELIPPQNFFATGALPCPYDAGRGER